MKKWGVKCRLPTLCSLKKGTFHKVREMEFIINTIMYETRRSCHCCNEKKNTSSTFCIFSIKEWRSEIPKHVCLIVYVLCCSHTSTCLYPTRKSHGTNNIYGWWVINNFFYCIYIFYDASGKMALMIPRKVLELVKILYYSPLLCMLKNGMLWVILITNSISHLFLQLSHKKCFVHNIFITIS